jgi:hypothetical protein
MELENGLPRSKDGTTGPYSELNKSSLCTHITNKGQKTLQAALNKYIPYTRISNRKSSRKFVVLNDLMGFNHAFLENMYE